MTIECTELSAQTSRRRAASDRLRPHECCGRSDHWARPHQRQRVHPQAVLASVVHLDALGLNAGAELDDLRRAWDHAETDHQQQILTGLARRESERQQPPKGGRRVA